MGAGPGEPNEVSTLFHLSEDGRLTPVPVTFDNVISHKPELATELDLVSACVEGHLFYKPVDQENLRQLKGLEMTVKSDDYTINGQTSIHLDISEPLEEIPRYEIKDPVPKPNFLMRLFSFFFSEQISKYNEQQRQLAENEKFASFQLAEDIQKAKTTKSFQSKEELHYLNKQGNPAVQKALAKGKDEQGLDELFWGEEAAAPKNVIYGSSFDHARVFCQSARYEKYLIVNALVKDNPTNLSPERLAQVMLAELLQEELMVQKVLREKENAPEYQGSPLFLALREAGWRAEDFENAAKEMAKTSVIQEMSKMDRDELLQLLVNPRQLSQKNSELSEELDVIKNATGYDRKNTLIQQNEHQNTNEMEHMTKSQVFLNGHM